MSLKIRRESALNLTLEGSIGSFSVGTGKEGQNSLEVKYFLTHVGLDFSSGTDEALLSHLAPVREIFDFQQLDFDEIMQRDIDDARVSKELITYLLDDKSRDLIKLFPPIVVVVLPVEESENRPANLYPSVTEEEQRKDDNDYHITRSGAVGEEVFQFEQPIDGGKILKHDLVRFRLNTHKTRLVIVDGQHRAMALLAIYRNLKDDWSDEKRAPFKEYYSEWTTSYIQQFNLKEINLPVILCTFPSLNENYTGEFNLKKAARSIFLTLNKTARKVSTSRNILLDDQDIISYFLRRCLSYIKDQDQHSLSSLRIFNIELDQSDDKVKIKSPIALTGVNHFNYIIEHLLLNKNEINKNDVDGIKARSGKFFKRLDLNANNCMDRLNGRAVLGAEAASTRRDSFTQAAADKLGAEFNEKYGNFIIAFFQEFALYNYHCQAVLSLEQKAETFEDRQIRPILFEGQGINRVFEAHRETLKEKLRESRKRNQRAPELEAIAKRLDGTARRIEGLLQLFKEERASLCIKSVSDKSKLKGLNTDVNPNIVKWFNDLYDNVLTTVAFQSALICGFFGEIEKTNKKILYTSDSNLDTQDCFNEYIEQINTFFVPKSSSQFKRLFQVFTGEISGEISDWKIIKTNRNFRDIVYSGEMQPEQWPKYKYLFLEIWKPSDELLNETVTEERKKCRGQVYSNLYEQYKNSYCKQNSRIEQMLNNDELKIIFNNSFTVYNDFLKVLGARDLDKEDMKNAVSGKPVASTNKYNIDDEDDYDEEEYDEDDEDDFDD